MRRLKFIVIGVAALLIALVAGFIIYAHLEYPMTSAPNVLSDMIYAEQHPHASLTAQTVGFLPYWRMGYVDYTQLDLLSEISFFSLSVGPDGHFIRATGGPGREQTEPGWRWWNTQQVKDLVAKAEIDGDKFGLTLAMLDNSDIRSFLASTKAWRALISDTLDQIHSRHLNCITLDFEYSGRPQPKYRRLFTAFATAFTTAIRQEASGTELELTLGPLAVREAGLFNVPQLVPLFDRFIGMSYDYYASGSDVAGPIAPMHGFPTHRFFFDVATTYRDFGKVIPRSKIVMGIPYYGYDWAVRNANKLLARTLPPSNPNNYAAILSYGRMRSFSELKPARCRWDAIAKEPHCWYFDPNHVAHQVWFENNRSIAIKYDFAKRNQLAGIAIWALGYDSSYPDLWDILQKTYSR